MKLVKNQSARIMKYLGYQKYDPSKKYKRSQFVFEQVLPDGDIVIHSTLTKYIYVLEEDKEKRDWQNFEDAPVEGKQFFVGLWFYVPEDMDEFELVLQVRNLYRIKSETGDVKLTGVSIVTTTGCNARCAYCFEKGTEPRFMSEQTAHDVAQFLIKHADRNNFRITWFGGEPLLNTKVIDSICKELHDNDVPFMSTIVTNGYLYSDEIIKKCENEWNVKTTQITLDGVGDKYNEIKAYVYKDTNAFDVVIGNIKKLLKSKISISIRINVGTDNIDSCYEVIDKLAEIKEPGDPIDVHCVMLFEFKDDEVKRTEEERDFLNRTITEMSFYIEEKKLTRVGKLNPAMQYNQCMADTKQSALITTEGRLTKCEHTVDGDGYGSVNDDPKDYDYEFLDEWSKQYKYGEMCHSCIHLPDCVAIVKCEDAYFKVYSKDGEEYHECWPTSKKRLQIIMEMGIRNEVNDYYYNLEKKERSNNEGV